MGAPSFRVCYETADELCTPTTVVSLMGSLEVWSRFANMRWYCNRHGYDVVILWEMSTLQIIAAQEAPQAVTVLDALQNPGALQAIQAYALQILQAEMHALQAEAEVLQDIRKLEEQQESKSLRAQQARQRLEQALSAHREQAIKARQAQRSRRLRQAAQVRQANQAQQEPGMITHFDVWLTESSAAVLKAFCEERNDLKIVSPLFAGTGKIYLDFIRDEHSHPLRAKMLKYLKSLGFTFRNSNQVARPDLWC
ncbi:hypothetical protein BO71DRAFT_425566 [Aspergillus ellipticus CBS 707.79]|uniref:Uncharacterized protein n=1 Tax=Aspergillus ellipticus CBS 707.79 TaxID=1448320 RepID=A0A319DR10_9EURO|nr:hypothetical protein BO71DRAFT_425566 [Aspergillus ellipticus CBS 707.79]